ncbi:MAG: molybdate ABC transporter permease subunit [Planctomycetes bacterium]|nr:molybdate ABC transporter permease subunit [Planctomycetota bacterium]
MTEAELDALRLSLQVGLVAVLALAGPAGWLAYWLARTERAGLRAAVEALVVLPLVLPPVVIGYLLLVLLGPRGPIGGWLYSIGIQLPFTWWGAALAAAVLGFPLMVRTMRQAFEAVDPGLEQAARTLGASRGRVWWTVTLPLALRGCVAGAVLCFARSLGEFGATMTFAGNIAGETRTLPLSIWTALQRADGDAMAWRATWICITIAVVAAFASEWLLRRAPRGGHA